jgi:hypothetical protein
MAATNVQAFSGDVEISSNLTAPFITGLGYVATRTHTFNPTGNTSKYFLGWTTREGMEIEINDNGFSHGSTQRFYITYSYDQTPYLSSADVSNDKVYNFYYTKKNERVYIWFNETRNSAGYDVTFTIRMKTLKNAINLTEPGAAETYEGTVIGLDNVSAFPPPILYKQEGRVGIGTNNPSSHLLEIYRNATNGASISLKSSGSYVATIGKKSSSSTDQSLQFLNTQTSASGESFKFLTTPDGTNFNHALTILGNRNVGIRRSDPGEELDVLGNMRASGGSGGSALRMRNFGSISRFYNSGQQGSGMHFTGGAAIPANQFGDVGGNLNINFGDPSYRWNTIYAKSALNTSDLNLKRDVVDVNQTEKRVAKRITNNIKIFRWKESYERKGEEARLHTGVIAQEVEQAFRDEGLDPFRYGILARSDHYEVNGDTKLYDKDGEWTGLFVDADTPGAVKVKDTYHMQYSELLCFIVSGMSDRLDSLETQLASVLARLDALESA